ncbi:MAG: class I SAM-dependent methyltransferase [Oscillochloridaceae bacterium umkhey_bin13]
MSHVPSSPERADLSLEYVPCALCGTDQTHLLAELGREGRLLTQAWPVGLHFKLVRCAQCSLAYINPRMTEAASPLAYDHAAEQAYFAQTYAARRRAYASLLAQATRLLDQPPTRLLDIGTGDGVLLELAQARGLQAIGTETSATLRAQISQQLGPAAIWDQPLATLPEASFDLVALLNVLEHVHQPAAMVAELAARLRPGGLALVHVPNFGGLAARLKGPRWHHLEPMDHLYYFTYRTLTALFAQVGLMATARFNLITSTGPGAVLQHGLGAAGIYLDNGLGVIFRRS